MNSIFISTSCYLTVSELTCSWQWISHDIPSASTCGTPKKTITCLQQIDLPQSPHMKKTLNYHHPINQSSLQPRVHPIIPSSQKTIDWELKKIPWIREPKIQSSHQPILRILQANPSHASLGWAAGVGLPAAHLAEEEVGNTTRVGFMMFNVNAYEIYSYWDANGI